MVGKSYYHRPFIRIILFEKKKKESPGSPREPTSDADSQAHRSPLKAVFTNGSQESFLK